MGPRHPIASDPVDPGLLAAAEQLHRATPVVDLHQDSLLWARLLGYDLRRPHRGWPWRALGLAPPLLNQSDLGRLRRGGVAGLGCGVVTAPWPRRLATRAARRTLTQLARLAAAEPDRLLLARRASDIHEAWRSGRVAAFPVLEGVHCLADGDLTTLAELQRAGLAGVGLVHFSHSWAGPSCSGRRARRAQGLTDAGRALVDECGRLGLLLDLAHLAGPAVVEAAARSTRPPVISHTGVAGVYRHWRNVDDDALRAVADRGGCIGVIAYPPYLGPGLWCDLARVVAHADHIVQVAGEEAVALGSDIDGFLPWLPDTLRGSDDLPRLTAAFLAAGWPPARLSRLLGGNALRVLAAAWGE